MRTMALSRAMTKITSLHQDQQTLDLNLHNNVRIHQQCYQHPTHLQLYQHLTHLQLHQHPTHLNQPPSQPDLSLNSFPKQYAASSRITL